MTAKSEKLRYPGSLLKWILSTLGVIILIIILTQLMASIFLDDVVGDYLKKQIRNSTNNIFD